VIILYSNRTGQSPPFSTARPRQQLPPPPLMYTLGGSKQPTFQLPATDIPSSSIPPMLQFQAQPSTFDTGTEDQLAWDEIWYDDILTTMECAPQQADELAASQLTQPPQLTVLTQPSQLAAGGATLAGGATTAGGATMGCRATPAGGRASPAAAERHRMLQARRRRPWRHRLPTS
jgi:hypothetical protein